MASLYTRIDSPFIWVRFYDKGEVDPRRRRKSISTKLLDNRDGWQAARELKKRIEAGLVETEIENKFGIRLKKRIKLSEGLVEYKDSKPDLADNTIRAYDLSVDHFIACNGDKYIDQYYSKDYSQLIAYFTKKGFNVSGQAIHTRQLSALWNFFLKKKYCNENIIIKLKAPKGSANSIPYTEMQALLTYYKEKNSEQYHLIYFLLLTGFRISSALVQTWDKIDWENEVIIATNVKAKHKIFYFPLHEELKSLLNDMKKKKKGRLFKNWAIGESPRFWQRDIELLVKRRKISKKYTLHDLRKTFTSWLVNAGVDQAMVQKLLDHSDIRVTDENYTKLESKLLKAQFNDIKFKK